MPKNSSILSLIYKLGVGVCECVIRERVCYGGQLVILNPSLFQKIETSTT